MHQLRPNHLGDRERLLGELHLLPGAAGMHVRTMLPLCRDTPDGGVLAITLKRQAVHHETAEIASRRLRNVALCDKVALSRDRLEYLVQIGIAGGNDLEHVLFS